MSSTEKEIKIKYKTEEITVLWQPQLCMHSGICARGLPEVFRPREKPWVDIHGAEAESIHAQVLKCPSGALSVLDYRNTTPEKHSI